MPRWSPPRRDSSCIGYKTVDQATKANPKEFNFSGTTNAAPAGWLGVVIGEKDGKPVIDAVAPESPAEAAGLEEGDVVVTLGGAAAGNAAARSRRSPRQARGRHVDDRQ